MSVEPSESEGKGVSRVPAQPSVGEFHGDASEWDDFVRSSDGWTHFHLYGWKEVMESVFGHETLYLCARAPNREALLGVLPLVRVKSLLFGHYLVSMPFVNYGGPLGQVRAVRALLEAARDRADRQGVKLLELRSRGELDVDMPASHRKITVVLDLPEDDPEILWKGFDSNVRRQVRRARKNGVTVSFGDDQVGPFFQVFSHHMRDLGTPTMPEEFFRAVAGVFPGGVRIGCAYHEGRPVAGGFGLCWNGEFEMTWVSALRDYHKFACNMLLYWSFMEKLIHEGIATFNFGRCSPGSGTHRFKSQWGSTDEQLWWYYHSDSGVSKTPTPEDSKYAWGPALWRRMPLSLANALGPRIVKYIP